MVSPIPASRSRGALSEQDMLVKRIDADMKDAARAKDARRLGTLRMLKSQMKYREIEKANPLDDADVVGVIGSMIKQRKDSAAQFTKGNRPELAANENAEMLLSGGQLPPPLH